jgi:3-oxoacyl-[acyl-carrier-protein] synthase-3
MATTITGMHYCIPDNILDNQEMANRFGERAVLAITKMAGVKERRVVTPGVTASDLGYTAAKRLLDSRGIDPKSIDLLIFVSQTGDYQVPATACVLHERLGLSDTCAAFDVAQGCSAFPYGACVASSMVEAGGFRRALLINADTVSLLLHPQDRGLVPLHGDAAAVSLIEPCEAGSGFLWFELGTDGTGHQHIIIPASGTRNPRTEDTKVEFVDDSGIVRTQEHLFMNGPAVFHFSLHKIPDVIRAALEKHQMVIEDFDLVLLHQANRTMVDMIYKALAVPPEKRFYFMEKVGNAAGASSPMLLAEAWRSGLVKPGQKVLLAAFGNGLSWGIMALRWPSVIESAIGAPVDYAASPAGSEGA